MNSTVFVFPVQMCGITDKLINWVFEDKFYSLSNNF